MLWGSCRGGFLDIYVRRGGDSGLGESWRAGFFFYGPSPRSGSDCPEPRGESIRWRARCGGFLESQNEPPLVSRRLQRLGPRSCPAVPALSAGRCKTAFWKVREEGRRNQAAGGGKVCWRVQEVRAKINLTLRSALCPGGWWSPELQKRTALLITQSFQFCSVLSTYLVVSCTGWH